MTPAFLVAFVSYTYRVLMLLSLVEIYLARIDAAKPSSSSSSSSSCLVIRHITSSWTEFPHLGRNPKTMSEASQQLKTKTLIDYLRVNYSGDRISIVSEDHAIITYNGITRKVAAVGVSDTINLPVKHSHMWRQQAIDNLLHAIPNTVDVVDDITIDGKHDGTTFVIGVLTYNDIAIQQRSLGNLLYIAQCAIPSTSEFVKSVTYVKLTAARISIIPHNFTMFSLFATLNAGAKHNLLQLSSYECGFSLSSFIVH
ncbi:hypothetical protein GQX74_005151 [Glossina fuscipes]|nr:hypothetical protein GQX74_005151 [Glossina fuscipes]